MAKKILDEEPRAIYTHCYGHALSLACSDAIKGSQVESRDARKFSRNPSFVSYQMDSKSTGLTEHHCQL